MGKLIAISPFQDLLPLSVTSCSLNAAQPDFITSIAVPAGQDRPLSAALRTAHGCAFPAPGRATGKDGARCVWVGGGQAMFLGTTQPDLPGAVRSDQSDGWAVMRLQGAGAEAVLARLVPVDLRAAVFKRGHCAKTLLNHVPMTIWRTGVDGFELMVFRSMIATAVYDLEQAMKSVDAQLTSPA